MFSATPSNRPLKIGLSPRFLHKVPPQLGFRGKTLQYLEQSIAHWLMTANALVFMIPSIEGGGLLRRSSIRIADYVAELDALVLQGGADVSPLTYGEQPLRPEWNGDRIRDMYEIDLLQEFVSAGKPVLGICRSAATACSTIIPTPTTSIFTGLPSCRARVSPTSIRAPATCGSTASTIRR